MKWKKSVSLKENKKKIKNNLCNFKKGRAVRLQGKSGKRKLISGKHWSLEIRVHDD